MNLSEGQEKVLVYSGIFLLVAVLVGAYIHHVLTAPFCYEVITYDWDMSNDFRGCINQPSSEN